jgi:predicted enzyme related to lactoylglutathione lyase
MPAFSTIRNITVDCRDPYELSRFWSQVTGWANHEDDQPGDPEAVLLPPGGEAGDLPVLLFIQVPETKTVKNRLHLDLQPSTSREQEVERLAGLGARVLDDRRRPDGSGWVVMADPEGNEFCVERSAAERAAHEP